MTAAVLALIASNVYTVWQIKIASENLELTTRPFLYVSATRWKGVISTSGDIGIRATFAVQKIGDKPARAIKVKKDFVVRISAPWDRDQLRRMSVPSKTLNPEQERFRVAYSGFRHHAVNEVASFFRESCRGQTEKEIEKRLNQKWEREGPQYRCEVYGSIENYYFKPWILGSEKANIEIGRSTSISNDRFLPPAGDLLFVYLVLEYQGLIKRAPYELHYIAYFDGNEMPAAAQDGALPLAMVETWDR